MSTNDLGKPYWQKNDNLDREKIEEYMRLSVEELDKLIEEEVRKSIKT